MKEKLKALTKFMKHKSLPLDLQVRIRRHFRFYWRRALIHDETEDEILRQLSTPLRHETLRVMYDTLIDEIPMFSILADQSFRDALLRSLHPLLVSPNEVLMRQWEQGEQMYLITQGLLDVEYEPIAAAEGAGGGAGGSPSSQPASPTASSNASEQLGGLGSLHSPGGQSRDGSDVGVSPSQKLIGTLGAGEHVGEISLIECTAFPHHLIAPFLPSSESSVSADVPLSASSNDAGSHNGQELGARQRSVGRRWARASTERSPFSPESVTQSLALEGTIFPLRTSTVTAQEHCELFAVHRLDFVALCKRYPRAKAQMVALATDRLEKTAAMEAEFARQATGAMRAPTSKAGRLKVKLAAAIAQHKKHKHSPTMDGGGAASKSHSSGQSTDSKGCAPAPSADASSQAVVAATPSAAAANAPGGRGSAPALAGGESLRNLIEKSREKNKREKNKAKQGVPRLMRQSSGALSSAADSSGHRGGKLGTFGTVMSASRVCAVDDFLSPVGTTVPMQSMRSMLPVHMQTRALGPGGPLGGAIGEQGGGGHGQGAAGGWHGRACVGGAAGSSAGGGGGVNHGAAAVGIDPHQIATAVSDAVAQAVAAALRSELTATISQEAAAAVRRELQKQQQQHTG